MDPTFDGDFYSEIRSTRNFLAVGNSRIKFKTGIEREVLEEMERVTGEAGEKGGPIDIEIDLRALEKKRIRFVNKEFDEEMQEYYKRREAGEILLGPTQEVDNLLDAEDLSDDEIYDAPDKVNEELEMLLKKEYPKRRLLEKKENEQIFIKKEMDFKNDRRGIIRSNIEKTRNKEQMYFRDIVSRFPTLAQMNIPALEISSNFSRNELHKLYSKYKALTEMTALDSKTLRFRSFFNLCLIGKQKP
jgi:hypothetical protein